MSSLRADERVRYEPDETAVTTDVASLRRAPYEDQVRALGGRLAAVWRRYPGDVLALSTLFLLSMVGLGLFWIYDNWLGEFDLLTMFIPWFGYIGDRLAAGEIPAWSPHYFGGAPVVGNPSGGWMYLQVMLLYSIFPILLATKMLLATHMLISGVAMYALGRKIGFAPVAALMSSSLFVCGQILYGGTSYMTIATQTATWMAVGLLATEMAMRTKRLSSTLGWGALLAVAIVQMFVAWPGQGVAYGCMWIGGWALWRLFVAPHDVFPKLADRLAQAFIFVASAGALTLGFGAWGILPMLDFLAESSVPGGDYSQVPNGDYAAGTDSLQRFLAGLFQGNTNYNFTVQSKAISAAAVTLAVIGLWRARKQYGALYFGGMFLFFASLMVTYSPTLWLFEHLPVLGGIHDHRPSGVAWLFSIGIYMLAGAAVQKLIDNDRPPIRLWHVTVLSALLILAFGTVNAQPIWTGWWGWLAAFLTIFVYALPTTDLVTPVRNLNARSATRFAIGIIAVTALLYYANLWNILWLVIGLAAAGMIVLLSRRDPVALITRLQPRLAILAAYALVGLMFVNPLAWDVYMTVKFPATVVGGFTDSPGKEHDSEWAITTSMLYKDPGTAAEFLQQQLLLGPFRYAGYALNGEPGPWTGEPNESHKSGYSWRRFEPGVVGILVNGRTYRLGLYQTGGYNPIQLKYWGEYVDIMNGKRQDYHWLDTFLPALDGSQLFDMLNVRYIVVDASIPEYRTPMYAIMKTHKEVYRDNLAIVFENESVYPHAWIVHEVQDNGDGFGVRLLASDNVDGREVAFVNTNGALPVVAPANNAATESANVISYEPEKIVLSATAATDGFMVLSDPYATGWKAYVDGAETPVYRTDHALRGIVLPAGEHTVEFRYEPDSIKYGMPITAASSVAIIGIWAWALVDWRRRRPQPDARPDRAPIGNDPDAA